jgi:hypothetical protein
MRTAPKEAEANHRPGEEESHLRLSLLKGIELSFLLNLDPPKNLLHNERR